MAAKKKTTTKKETTEKKTTKKTTAKSKKIKIMYNPIGFTAEQMSFPLRTKQYNGTALVSVPLIEGLPMELSFKKGDILEVTPEQLQQLQAIKVVESDEERKARKDFIKNLPDQYPNTANDEDSEAVKRLLTANDLQSKIYNDRLIICD